MPSNRIARGFTLIELLVVIAIIILLISMLVPALEKAMAAAQTAKCAAQARAMSYGVRQYATDNRYELVSWTLSYPNAWWHRLKSYFNDPSYAEYQEPPDPAAEGNDGILDMMLCPSSTPYWMPNRGHVGDGYYMPSATRSWGSFGATGSYVINTWASRNEVYRPGLESNWGDRVFYKFTELRGQTPIFADSFWIDMNPRHHILPDYSRVNIKRHNAMGVNYANVDGSTFFVPQTEVHYTSWHR